MFMNLNTPAKQVLLPWPRAVALGVLLLASVFQPAQAQTPTTTERIEALEAELGKVQSERHAERGQRLFAQACAACHGSGGQGDGPGASDLDPAPRDLTARHFRFRSTANGQHPRPEDLTRTIREGLPGTSMPAFGNVFSEESIEELVGYINSLHPALAEDGIPDAIEPTTVFDASPESIRDGQAIYLLSGCWRCHGVRGNGKGPSAKTLLDDADNTIHATDFRYDPFKGGRDTASVVRALRTGLNGTPMPSYDDAMLIAQEDRGGVESLEGQLDAATLNTVETFLKSSPSRSALKTLSTDNIAALRDRRMTALAHYVLSLERRSGFFYRLFREEPEKEARP